MPRLNRRTGVPITGAMSLDATLARVGQIEALLAPSRPAPAVPASPPAVGTPTSFATQLQGALAPTMTTLQPVASAAPGGAAAAIVRIAETQLGQAEQPPGSNDSPQIAEYRTATAGAQAGQPWCAYFASWVARQAGEPIGDAGQGLGYVGDIWNWAQATGRAVPNGPGVTPTPGELIVFGDHHVGIVEAVRPDGAVQTIEGNYANEVSRVVRGAGEATGYVRM